MSNKVNIGDKVFVVDEGSTYYRDIGKVIDIETGSHLIYPVTVEFTPDDWCIFEHKDLVVIPQ